jgi:hypothetical protein
MQKQFDKLALGSSVRVLCQPLLLVNVYNENPALILILSPATTQHHGIGIGERTSTASHIVWSAREYEQSPAQNE